MMTNDRSTRRYPQRRIHQVTTTDPQRRVLWRRLFGADVLPVKRPFPEIFVNPDGREHLAYVLDSRQMAPQQIHNLASYLQARVWGLSYQDAQRRAREQWTIDAAGVELVEPLTGSGNHSRQPRSRTGDNETAVSDERRPFFVALFVGSS